MPLAQPAAAVAVAFAGAWVYRVARRF
jgi:hypothetical protein